jgi:hypothetical protein
MEKSHTLRDDDDDRHGNVSHFVKVKYGRLVKLWVQRRMSWVITDGIDWREGGGQA